MRRFFCIFRFVFGLLAARYDEYIFCGALNASGKCEIKISRVAGSLLA